ncbi:NAD-dependent epimerase/dehydratase family protein [Gallaecimonas sp. GXIMD1310]|uniref:NAD-dependent epimerase/dehydratase family protein n=1 Tax=Gallaecimonas sp. GXIMD1310 TaxID=3131926 RepID=UPI003255C1AE
MELDTKQPVMVTGATGYVAGWLIKRLLEAGFTVHGTVRNPDDSARLQYLYDLEANSPGTLTLFKADLLDASAFDAPMAGCAVVFHTASPFTSNITDPQRDLVKPALHGTRNVLAAVERSESVTRVVLTSSCAAIYSDNIDLKNKGLKAFDESVWNTTSSLEHQAYNYSKTLAEREAWAMAEGQSRWQLVVVNPSLVLGPGINAEATSESFSLMRQLGDGTMKIGAPDWPMGVVDVRDLAEAHLRAAFTPEAHGRHVISGHDTSFLVIAKLLAPRYGSRYALPRRQLPKWLAWLAGPLANPALTRKMISLNVGHPWHADHSKSVRELGMTYRPLKDTVEDFFEQLIASGQLNK